MKKIRCVPVALFCLCAVPPGLAAEISGGVTAGVSRTDNVLLAPSPDEVDEIVYQAAPWVRFDHTSSSLDAQLNYRYEWYKYDDLDATSSFHIGDVMVTGKALDEALQVEVGASRNQVLSDPRDVIPGGRLPLSQNVVDRDMYWINPRLIQQFGRSVNLTALYRYWQGMFDDPRFQDDTNQFGFLQLDNYSRGSGVTWALSYDWRRTDYEFSRTWEYQRAKAELGYWAGSNTRLFGAYGQESAFDMPFDPALADPFWEVGFSQQAGENLSAEFAGGERAFGTSWRGNLDFEFRRGSTSLSYVETPMTIGFNSSGNPGGFSRIRSPIVEFRPDADSDPFDEFLDQPGRAERFLSKRFEWVLDLRYRRTSFLVSAFDENRSQRLSSIATPLPDQSQTGARMAVSVDLGVRSTLSLSGRVIDRDSGGTNKSRFINGRVGFRYRIGSKTDVSLEYRYDEQRPRDDSTAAFEYQAQVVSLLFTYRVGENQGEAPAAR